MVVDHDDFAVGGDFGMVQAKRHDGEVDAVVVVVGGHADGECHHGTGAHGSGGGNGAVLRFAADSPTIRPTTPVGSAMISSRIARTAALG